MGNLLWLALGAFAIGTEGMMIAGLLPSIASDLHITAARAGDLVVAFGLAYAVGSPLIAAATGAIERKKLLLISLAAFGIANLGAALAPNYVSLMIARALLALTAGTFMPAATAFAATIVDPEHRGRAISRVYTGFTLALVIGVPIGTAIGSRLGWRATFVAIAILSALAWLGVALALPRMPGGANIGIRARLAVAARPGMLPILALTVIALAGAFSLFVYFGPWLHATLGLGADGLALFLGLFGLAAFIGNLGGGYVADRFPARTAIRIGMSVVALALVLMESVPEGGSILSIALVAIGVLAWGIFGWGFMPVQQARLVGLAPNLASVSLSLNASAIYIGASLGAFLGGLVQSSGAVHLNGWVGVGASVLGLIWLTIFAGKSTPRVELSSEVRAQVAAGE